MPTFASAASQMTASAGRRSKIRGDRAIVVDFAVLNSRLQLLARRRCMNGESVHATCQFARECRVDHAVTFDPALSAEGFRHDIKAEVGLAAGPVSGVAFVLVGFVLDVQALGRESAAQLFGNEIASLHGAL